jgi:hypothetical protein
VGSFKRPLAGPADNPPPAASAAAPDQAWLRARLEELERIPRSSASQGERRAAEWLVEHFAAQGVEARIEGADAHGTYWWPLGLGAALGAIGGIAALRGHRRLGAALGALGAAGIADDFPPRKRGLRRLLAKRTTHNVIAEIGAPDAARTIVVIAHHDAAHAGLVFHPAIPKVAARLGMFEHADTSPALMAPVIGGPLLVGLGALTGIRALTRVGLLLSLGSAAAMADIGARSVVPGANDNGTAVVTLLALAAELSAEPPLPDLRVVLLSTGAEESFSEGMKAFGERHFAELPTESTFFLCVESTGSPHLLVLRGEGFLRIVDYPERSLALLDGLAAELGIDLIPDLRLHNGTDGMEALGAGYESAVLASCTDLKQPANYHWPNDLAANVDFDTVADGIRLSAAAIRRLGERWL